MKLSIIVPSYNEERTIKELIRRIESVKFPIDYEIVLIDDGSTDRTFTKEVILKLKDSHHQIRLYHNRSNQGKGSCIRRGRKLAHGDIVIIQDADLELDPNDIPRLIEPIIQGKTDVVYGSRFLKCYWPRNMKLPCWLANRALTLLANILYRTKITDEATCYKVFRTSLLRDIRLRCRGFEFCPEITAKLGKRNIHIMELPISYVGRASKVGKKISVKDFFIAIWTLLIYKLMD